LNMRAQANNKKFVYASIGVVFLSLLAVMAVNVAIDPLGIIWPKWISHPLEKAKSKVGRRDATAMRIVTAAEYDSNPNPYCIIGDSRAGMFSVENIKKITGDEYYKFVFGGATAMEITEVFWYTARRVKLKKVYLVIPFNIYNDNKINSIFREAAPLSQNWIRYASSSYVLRISLGVVIKALLGIQTGSNVALDAGDIMSDKEAFWKYQIGAVERSYSIYIEPKIILKRLKEIKEYCDSQGIKLVFVIPPSHLDLQKVISKYNLDDEFVQFKKDLRSLSTTYDYDYPNRCARSRQLFDDPWHGKKLLYRVLEEDIFESRLDDLDAACAQKEVEVMAQEMAEKDRHESEHHME